MRFIQKRSVPPSFVTTYIAQRIAAGQVVTYNDFPYKKELNEILRREQRNVCCYCQQSIDHFQGINEGGSHNEHLVPQHGQHGNPALEMDYYNLYACCNYTRDLPWADAYCGWHKGMQPIISFLQDKHCKHYFKYNIIGEILPNGAYFSFDEYIAKKSILPQNQKDALEAISILNLNQEVLRKRRKLVIEDFFRLAGIYNLSKQSAALKIQRLNNENPYTPFLDARIYYLNEFVNK